MTNLILIFLEAFLRKSTFIVIGFFALVIILAVNFVGDPVFEESGEELDYELSMNHTARAVSVLYDMVREDKLNIDNHHRYIHTYIKDSPHMIKNDSKLMLYYSSMTHYRDSALVDIGYYGKGLIKTYQRNYEEAIKEFNKVRNRELKHLNNSLGYAYRKYGYVEGAELHFRKEIALGGNVEDAYSNLIRLLYYYDRQDDLKRLLDDKQAREYFPTWMEKEIYVKEVRPLDYSLLILRKIASWMNVYGFLAAFLIMCCWVIYLRKIDIFEPEKWRDIILAVLLGMLFCFFAFPLSDFVGYVLGFELNGNLLNDFLYCTFAIGAVEELVKIIPFLLILKFTKAINEPIDYIKYASLTALGFAFIENLIYFEEHKLYIIHGRALTAVVGHMFDSSVIGYGMMLNKYKRRWNPFLNFLLFFLLASLAHGFYDFWLLNDSARRFSFITILFFFVCICVWNSFKNNALNNSEFFDERKSINNDKLQDFLMYSLSGILLFEYIVITIKFGSSFANEKLLTSVAGGTYLIIFLSTNLSKFVINKDEWAPIRFWRTDEKFDFNQFIGMDLVIDPYTHNAYSAPYLPNRGKIAKRILLKQDDAYIVELDYPAPVSGYMNDTIMIRHKEWEPYVRKDENKLFGFYLIPEGLDLEAKELKQANFLFCGWVVIN